MTTRELVRSWLQAGLDAVDPEDLTKQALTRREGPATVIAIGKAAAGMCRGAAAALGSVDGLCVSNHESPVPIGIDFIIGDHPVPGPASFEAGRRALELAPDADLALISGGGSALCESPIDGVDREFVSRVHRALVDAGASIEEVNLVRSHLSAIKSGGLGPLPTYVLSDVAGAPPGVVSSGPTIVMPHQPGLAVELMRRFGIDLPKVVEEAMHRAPTRHEMSSIVEVIGDGRTAAAAVAAAVTPVMRTAHVDDRWLDGSVDSAVDRLLSEPAPGVMIATGETTIGVSGSGRGGRNTHAALLAATVIAETGSVFAALATDGIDGRSGAAGAIVDGGTILRGGDPSRAIETFDSATYLRATGDLIETGPTGTNVGDLWLIWAQE